MKLASNLVLLGVLAFSTVNAFATTHTIQFGGTLGNVYSPATLNVNVGDTIVWQGEFANHPLQSVSVPSGASALPSMSSGTTAMYVITKAGSYSYKCIFHASIGMTGTIAAAAAGVAVQNAPELVSQNYPNPAIGHETMIHLMLDKPEHVRIDLFDANGKLVLTPMNAMQPEGMQMVSLDLLGLSSGSYSYVVTIDGKVTRKNMVILK